MKSIEEFAEVQQETFETLWRVCRTNVALEENLRVTSERSSELLLENRALKKQLAYLETQIGYYPILKVLLAQAKEKAEGTHGKEQSTPKVEAQEPSTPEPGGSGAHLVDVERDGNQGG